MRSDFLVHWTGRDLGTDPSTLDDAQRSAYVDRLADILTNGLWMTTPPERIEGNNGSWIHYDAPMTCFTEIRLSQAGRHAQRYGLLGVGVTRLFVLERLGGPVQYVRNHGTECIIGNIQEILGAIRTMGRADLVQYLAVNSAFVKAMSSPNADDFAFLDEEEWRIVQTDSQTSAGRVVATGLFRPKFRVPVQPGDVRLLVLPDSQTRALARADVRLGAWFHSPPSPSPVLLTVEECGHF